MSRAFKYTLLMASLPHHPKDLLSAKQTPISEIQLEKRLQLLDAQDQAQLKLIEDMIFWVHVKDLSDAEIIAEQNADMARIRNAFLYDLLVWRLSLRTLVSALRMRRRGFKPSPQQPFVGFGKWPRAINKNWEHPTFGISKIEAPWLADASELIGSDRTSSLDKLLLDVSWRYYTDLCNWRLFDFEAVVLYVLRWDVINRWSHYQRESINNAARTHFMHLVDYGLSSCPIVSDHEFPISEEGVVQVEKEPSSSGRGQSEGI